MYPVNYLVYPRFPKSIQAVIPTQIHLLTFRLTFDTEVPNLILKISTTDEVLNSALELQESLVDYTLAVIFIGKVGD